MFEETVNNIIVDLIKVLFFLVLTIIYGTFLFLIFLKTIFGLTYVIFDVISCSAGA